jgi:hypothetical protein
MSGGGSCVGGERESSSSSEAVVVVEGRVSRVEEEEGVSRVVEAPGGKGLGVGRVEFFLTCFSRGFVVFLSCLSKSESLSFLTFFVL